MKQGIIILFLSALLLSCSRDPSKYGESPTTGNITISADETFSRIINEEIDVFENIYVYAKIKPEYKPEVEVINDLLKEKVRLIIVSRKLTEEEKKYFNDKKLFPKEVLIAHDAIALIINPSNNDSIISVENFRKILTGEMKNWNEMNQKSELGEIKVVFDNTNSSTVRYVIDSVTGTNELKGNVSAVKYNNEVVEFVSNNPSSIGIIGVNWVSNDRDSTSLSFMKKVRVMHVSKESNPSIGNSFQPYQAYIALKKYPLRRDIYAINCDPKNGLAGGFLQFLASDRGQRIILKSSILPATQPVRIVDIKNEF